MTHHLISRKNRTSFRMPIKPGFLESASSRGRCFMYEIETPLGGEIEETVGGEGELRSTIQVSDFRTLDTIILDPALTEPAFCDGRQSGMRGSNRSSGDTFWIRPCWRLQTVGTGSTTRNGHRLEVEGRSVPPTDCRPAGDLPWDLTCGGRHPRRGATGDSRRLLAALPASPSPAFARATLAVQGAWRLLR